MTVNSFTISGRYDELVEIARVLLDAGIKSFITGRLVIHPADGLQHSFMMVTAKQFNKPVIQFSDEASVENKPERKAWRASW